MIILTMLAQQFKIPGTTGSEDVPIPSGIPSGLQGKLEDSGKHVFQTGLDLLFYGAVILATISIIYSGIQWITSSGDAGKIQRAKKRLFYAIIGLVIVVLAFLIFNIVAGVLGKSSTTLLSPP